MYNTKKEQIFFVYDKRKDYVEKIGNEKDLKDFLLKSCCKSYLFCILERTTNRYFDEVDLTGKDLDYNGFVKNYVFFDNFDRIIDINIYKKDIYNYFNKNYKEKGMFFLYNHNSENELFEYKEVVNKKCGRNEFISYKFRYDPVPFVHKRKNTKYYRSPKIKHIIKECNNKEYKTKRKEKYKHLEYVWYDDFPLSNYSKSWKDCTKKRKQWM